MKRFCDIILWSTIVCLCLWIIPWTYNFIFVNSYTPPFMIYSQVTKSFVGWIVNTEEKIYIDEDGNKLNVKNVDSLLPLHFCRQLIKDNSMPDSINGVKIDINELLRGTFSFSYSPITHNHTTIDLYLLFKSTSGRVNLEMPNDVMRFTNHGVEFIDMNSNTIKTKKSQLFSDVLIKKGFKFPLVKAVGNATIHKDYDNGYLLLDSKGKLFHLKQIKGRPYLKAIDMPEGVNVKSMIVTEFKNMRHLGFVFDTDNQMWTIHANDYSFHKIAIDYYDCSKQYLKILANKFDWTISVRDNNGDNLYAISNDDYSLLRKHTIKYENDIFDEIGKYILPLKLKFTTSTDEKVYPRFKFLTY